MIPHPINDKSSSKVHVSVIVPIRNEEAHVADCLTSLVGQTYPSSAYEIMVVDGRSSDRSLEIVGSFCKFHANVRCLDNPKAIAPCAMNLGIRMARGDVIIRADGHNTYPADYIQNCVKYLEETGADNVGGPWVTVPVTHSFEARLVAAVLTSPFGVGNSKVRIGSDEGFVETVPFGAFRRDVFERVGMYNEKLVRNQDNELNARIRQAGGKIYQAQALATHYHPISGLWKLLRITFRTSQWHLFTIRENRGAMGIRHLVPALFVAAAVGLLLASPFSDLALLTFAVLVLVHLLAGAVMSAFRSDRYGTAVAFALPIACLAFHTSYGLGTLAGIRYLLKAPLYQPIRDGQAVGR